MVCGHLDVPSQPLYCHCDVLTCINHAIYGSGALRPVLPPGSHPATLRTFSTNFGPITVRRFDPTGFSATYTHSNGRAEGEADGDTVTGIWTQASGGHPCLACWGPLAVRHLLPTTMNGVQVTV